MALLALFLKTFFAFFAVMDPVGSLPVFFAMTATNTETERRQMARRACITAFFVLAFFGATQLWLFDFFGFTMGAFRVAGGLFLFIIAFEMLTAHTTGARQTDEEKTEGTAKHDISITPLAIPLLAGPATITGVILAFGQAHGSVWSLSAVFFALVAVCTTTWLILRGATRLNPLLGATGSKIISRMMGLILAAMAVQFTAAGMLELFQGLAR
jgi:multiple antibiotic resistance protein